MWRAAIFEGIDISLNCGDVDSMSFGTFRQKLGVVDPLRSGQDLFPSHKHIVGVGPFLEAIKIIEEIKMGFGPNFKKKKIIASTSVIISQIYIPA